ncbi:hypothetical protein B5807_08698 [Epicoccum nigrum]|uniref:Uncharacterized protein n=1 Tax=Epicoccum nigrum TaxID=105696 RepID=A0A1Y2LR58_EPING|nr:hypothetical protein B5807_08698 [Epicoccum nigrum]
MFGQALVRKMAWSCWINPNRGGFWQAGQSKALSAGGSRAQENKTCRYQKLRVLVGTKRVYSYDRKTRGRNHNRVTPGNAGKQMPLSDVVVAMIHVRQLVLPSTVSSPTSPRSSCLANSIFSGWFRALGTKVYGPQLTPLACPHSKRSHDGGADCLQCPPEEM